MGKRHGRVAETKTEEVSRIQTMKGAEKPKQIPGSPFLGWMSKSIGLPGEKSNDQGVGILVGK